MNLLWVRRLEDQGVVVTRGEMIVKVLNFQLFSLSSECIQSVQECPGLFESWLEL